ncbi:unnamed protein product [Closterium sp. NIES-54]
MCARGDGGSEGGASKGGEGVMPPWEGGGWYSPRHLPSFRDSPAPPAPIIQAWDAAYGLSANLTAPPPAVRLPVSLAAAASAITAAPGDADVAVGAEGRVSVPPAPHLEDCARVTWRRAQAEWRRGGRQGAGGEMSAPAWAQVQEGGQQGPLPPWIRGADEDNLALTRIAQTDLWLHQFPPSCSPSSPSSSSAAPVRFLLVEWKHPRGHGLGSQLHIMSAALSLAFFHGRVLVPAPGSFSHAAHNSCSGPDYGSLSCYFFPLTSLACQQQALSLWQQQQEHGPSHPVPPPDPGPALNELLQSNLPVVFFPGVTRFQAKMAKEASAAFHWGTPWVQRQVSTELLGQRFDAEGRYLQVSWWRSQSLRFMLRWPSRYLCHLLNRARHDTYGYRVALRVAATQTALLTASDDAANSVFSAAADAGGGGAGGMMDGGVVGEPFIFRPIVSMHVRQGDKGHEMLLFSLASYVYLGHRLRLHVPNLKHVWLSTEMQTVVDEAVSRFQDWIFLFTKVQRQTGNKFFYSYEQSAGPGAVTAASFVNLIIASECDFFVGALASNWNRLINELRLTNGRYRSGYLALNHAEWNSLLQEVTESASAERAHGLKPVSDQLFPRSTSVLEWPVVRSGHGSDQGPRKNMEDAHVMVDDLTKSFGDLSFSRRGSFYGVFDGHGGDAAAKFVSSQLLGNILSDPSFPDRVGQAICNAFMRTDRELEMAHTLASEPMESGTTALAVLLLGKALYVANAGDCRAVLCRRGKVVELSRDHRPSCQLERERVHLAGGFIVEDYLNDQLAVTRALGDWHLQGMKNRAADGETVVGPLIAEPELREAELTEEDEFLVIGCDGLWDAFRHSHEVVSFARKRLRVHNNPQQCSQELVQEAIRRDSGDNVTVVTVCFSAQPPPPLQHQEFRNSRLRRSFSANELQSS